MELWLLWMLTAGGASPSIRICPVRVQPFGGANAYGVIARLADGQGGGIATVRPQVAAVGTRHRQLRGLSARKLLVRIAGEDAQWAGILLIHPDGIHDGAATDSLVNKSQIKTDSADRVIEAQREINQLYRQAKAKGDNSHYGLFKMVQL